MRRFVAAVLLFGFSLQQAACMTPPRPVASPRTYIPIRKPEVVWLVDTAGKRVAVTGPRAVGDTLYGFTPAGDEVWIAFRDARRIEAREMDRTRTMAAIGGGLLAIVLAVSLAHASGSGIEQEEIDRPAEDKPYIGLRLRW